MPRGLIAETNVCKKISQEIYEIFKVQNLDEYHHVSQFNLASPNLYCISHITFMHHLFHSSLCTFMYHVLYTSLCIFRLYIHCFSFFVIDRTRKQTLFIKRFNFVFIKDIQSVSHSNERAITAENEQQYNIQ